MRLTTMAIVFAMAFLPKLVWAETLSECLASGRSENVCFSTALAAGETGDIIMTLMSRELTEGNENFFSALRTFVILCPRVPHLCVATLR